MKFRIGMHMGDVIESKGDIYGDAVNIASRIEPLAEAGGICLSRHVYEHVKNKVQFNFKSLGFKSLKNVKEQVEIFKIMMPWEEAKDIYASSDLTRIAVLPFTNISPDRRCLLCRWYDGRADKHLIYDFWFEGYFENLSNGIQERFKEAGRNSQRAEGG